VIICVTDILLKVTGTGIFNLELKEHVQHMIQIYDGSFRRVTVILMWRALVYMRNNWGMWNRNALCSTEGKNFKSTRHKLFQALKDSTENMWFSFRSVMCTGSYTYDNIQQLLCVQYMCGFCLVITVNENYLHKH